MGWKVSQLATLVQGQIDGPDDTPIQAAKVLHQAGPGDVTFLENEINLKNWKGCTASAVVIPANLRDRVKQLLGNQQTPCTLIVVKEPLLAFVSLVQHISGWVEPAPHGIDPRAVVDPTAQVGADPSVFPLACVGAGTVIGARCKIHSGAVIGKNCKVGDDVVLYPGAVLYDNTVLGNRVIIHANAVIGADGFGYRMVAGKHVKIPQLGSVELGDDVEIGACTTIDRGTFQATRVGAGTKIDNLVQIGHNCTIGRNNLLVSQVGIAGSCTTGDYVVMAGQVGIADHIHIGDMAQVGAKSGVMRDIPSGERQLGAPAIPERDQKRILLCIDRLPNLWRDVRRIKDHLQLPEEPAA